MPKIKKVRVAKGVKIPRVKKIKLSKKPGGSATGKYKGIKKSDFAGSAGGTSPYSYPINTLKRAKEALSYASHAPNPAGIKRKVYAKYPQLKKRKEEQDGNKRKK